MGTSSYFLNLSPGSCTQISVYADANCGSDTSLQRKIQTDIIIKYGKAPIL